MLSRPEDLTNTIIHQIGESYYQKYPKGKWLTWLTQNNNHHLADKLKKYGTAFSDAESSPREKWNFLLQIYKEIQDPYDPLAKMIDEIFKKGFGLTQVCKIKMCEGIPLPLNTEMVAHNLKTTVDAHLPVTVSRLMEYK